jgi:hypothetical protein
MALSAVMETIGEWFEHHGDDGEFVRAGRAHPYSVIGPTARTSQVIFCTKPSVMLSSMRAKDLDGEFSMIGRYGLPGPDDCQWIAHITRSRTLTFVGDLDPVDWMVFLWLREGLGRKRVTFGGISDRLLSNLKVRVRPVQMIEMATSERRALGVVNTLCPEVGRLIGARCSTVIGNGHKIELESILRGRRITVPKVLKAIREC